MVNFMFFANIKKTINFRRGAIVDSNGAIKEQSFEL